MPKNIIGHEYGPRWELLDPEKDEGGSAEKPDKMLDGTAEGRMETKASVDRLYSSVEALNHLRENLLGRGIKRRYRELTRSSYLPDEVFPLLRERRVEEAKLVLAAIRRRDEEKQQSSRQFFALFGLMLKRSRTHQLPPIRPEEIGMTQEEQDFMKKCVGPTWYEEAFGKVSVPTD